MTLWGPHWPLLVGARPHTGHHSRPEPEQPIGMAHCGSMVWVRAHSKSTSVGPARHVCYHPWVGP